MHAEWSKATLLKSLLGATKRWLYCKQQDESSPS
jgi:hypothetical protein